MSKFLKKSGLSDVVLSRIWDLSDPTGRGFLNREGLFVALKLVALGNFSCEINLLVLVKLIKSIFNNNLGNIPVNFNTSNSTSWT